MNLKEIIMKKKNLKSLHLNKRSISSFEAQSINGGSTFCTTITYFTEEILEIASWVAGCIADEDPVTSSICADTQNDDSCQCTVA
jgi:hypothetical protein